MRKISDSGFSGNLAAVNGLSFKKWVFEPGMPFGSEMKWWGDKGPRGARHNGLDLRLYETPEGNPVPLDAGAKIPAICDGTVVKIVRDFLGHSLFAETGIREKEKRLFTVYGHVRPVEGIASGASFKKGEIIARLAGKNESGVPPHLHITLALVPGDVSVEGLSWEKLDSPADIVLLDPMGIIY